MQRVKWEGDAGLYKLDGQLLKLRPGQEIILSKSEIKRQEKLGNIKPTKEKEG